MTRIDLHPEELLDRARRGQASPEELARLRDHLSSCSACRFEHAFGADCDRETTGAPDAGEIRRIARSSVTALLAGKHAAPERPRWPRFALAAVAIACVATAAVGAILQHQAAPPPPDAAAPNAVQRPAPEPAQTTAPTAPAASVEIAPPPHEGPAPSGARQARPAPSTAEPSLTAAELFAQANAARRRGELGRAVEQYRELARAFPGSSEALVSRVALGRVLLDRLGNPAGALAEFDAYLARSSHGALREEALIGRALALGRLGRRAEERGAWQALLTGYPSSAYAARARERLERLQTH